MELEFQKTIYPCMQQVKREVQNAEQTLEIRIDDDLPDIGRVLCAWGQVLLRGKEWHRDEMRVSAAVMAWVLYAPEDGSMPRCVEGWIPLQMRWDLPNSERDGTILTSCLLRHIDARSISARRLMLRAGVSVLGEAVMPGEMWAYTPEDLPEDVQIRKHRYPLEVPAEAGEKPFSLEAELAIPAGAPKPEKKIYCTVTPQIVDQKVMTDKVVFRGVAAVHLLYRGEDGQLHSFDSEIPFSHFGELERDYDLDATASVLPAVTGLDVETDEEGRWIIKADLTGQYVIYSHPVLEIVEDLYSTSREAEPIMETIPVTAVLERTGQVLTAEQTVPADVDRVIDASVMSEQGSVMRSSAGAELTVPGMYQLLYTDMAGDFQCMTAKWEENWDVAASENSRVAVQVHPTGAARATTGAGSVTLRGDICVDMLTTNHQGMDAVRGIRLGAQQQPDPDRPSLILCRCHGQELWEVAKSCKTTVDAICKANDLEVGTADDRMLLIPIP